MNYGMIKWSDDINADGLSVSIYPSGCNMFCKNCFNKDLQDKNYGNEFTIETKNEILNYFEKNYKYLDNLCVLGGHMFEHYNYDTMLDLIKEFKIKFPNKKAIVWTGYTYEYILDEYKESLIYIDILCDGKFDETKYSRDLKYVGSSNQLIIDVQESLKQNKKVLFYENKV